MSYISRRNHCKVTRLHCLRACVFLTVLTAALFMSPKAFAQKAIWVGETYKCEATSAVIGLTSDISWSVSGGYLSLSGSGFYRNVTATQFWSGTATVTCSWKYRYYSNDTWKTQSKSWMFTCNENKVSITPASMTLSIGESDYVGYSHMYSNSYVSAANAYFSSSNSSIATVSSSGQVTGVSPGTCYIMVYSKLSDASKAPYCTVTVKAIEPQSARIQSPINVVAGDTKQLSVSLTPSNATQKSISWKSNDESVATVNSSGLLKAVKHGTTSVYCVINGSLKSNEAIVTVSKQTLTLTADKDNGLLEKGSVVSLKASNSDAEIYYTLDGSAPSKNSIRYNAPVVIDKDLTLKAVAYHDDYNSSNVLTKVYKVTSLKVDTTYPENNTNNVGDYVIPYIIFNSEIKEGNNVDEIFLRVNASNVLERIIISGNVLYLVPKEIVQTDNNFYTIEIPENGVQNKLGEPNTKFVVSYKIKSSNSQYSLYAKNVYAGDLTSSCLTSDGSLFYWGALPNSEGSWIYPYSFSNSPYADNMLNKDVITSCKSKNHYGYIKPDNSLYMWGNNGWGCLGNSNDALGGGFRRWTDPYKVMENVEMVSCGGSTGHTLALTYDGILYGWGSNIYNELTSENVSAYYSPVKLMEGVKYIYAGNRTTFVIKNDGSLWFWGQLYTPSRYPQSTYTRYLEPIKISDDVIKVSSLLEYAPTFIKSDKTLWICNDYLVPSKVTESVIDVEGSECRGMYIKEDGSLWSWGNNNYGQRGDGFIDEKRTTAKEAVKVMDNVRQISITHDYSLALTKDGSVWGWGSNERGNIKFEYGDNRPVPELIWSSIKSVPVVSVSLTSLKDNIAVQETIPLQLRVNPADSYISKIKWSSSNPTVAVVSQRGIVTGVAEGETEISAFVESENEEIHNATYKIKVSGTTGVQMISDFTFKVNVKNGVIHLEGLSTGEKVYLYDIAGILLYEAVSFCGVLEIPCNGNGIYIIKTNKGKSVKVMNQ